MKATPMWNSPTDPPAITHDSQSDPCLLWVHDKKINVPTYPALGVYYGPGFIDAESSGWWVHATWYGVRSQEEITVLGWQPIQIGVMEQVI